MFLICRLLLCLLFLPVVSFSQQRTAKVMAGPFEDDQFRIAVAFMGVTDDSYKLQSLIVTVNRTENKSELPTEYYVDLTTTTRSLASGAKKQKILVFRWGKSGEMKVKCEGGTWSELAPEPEINKIVEIVKAVVENAPRDTKEPVDFNLPAELQEKVIAILNGLETSKLQCVRSGA
jgi:hypothetical protein